MTYTSQRALTVVNEDGDRFSVAGMLVGSVAIILWCRNGEVRLVPRTIFQNARELLESYLALIDMGRLMEIPPGVGTIQWTQTVPLIPNECVSLPLPIQPPQ